MKYYIDNNSEIFAYESDGSQDFLIGDKTQITEEDVERINNEKEIQFQQTIAYRISEAKKYLADTDFKMTLDYDKDVSEVKIKRAEARQFIRANEGASE